MGDILLPTHL